jgi:hypothetical protein
MPALERPGVAGSFHPPPTSDLSERREDPRETSSAICLAPCHFRIDPYPEPVQPIRILQQAMKRHRLLFLWYAQPRHMHVPLSLTPGKEELYGTISLPDQPSSGALLAEDVFRFAIEIEEWLREQQGALGRGPKGKPLRDIANDWPTPYFAFWALEPEEDTPLADSHAQVAKLVGLALRDPLPGWIRDEDASLVRQCEVAARPLVVDDTGKEWHDRPLVQWNYPDVLQNQIESLDHLVTIESGAKANPPTPAPAVAVACLHCAVGLHGPGQPPTVLGQPMPILSDARYTVVEALIEAGPEGLSKDQIEIKVNSAARKTLKKLAESDPRWAKVIQLPGLPGMRYRLLHSPTATST